MAASSSSAPPKPPAGVDFPVDSRTKERSSTEPIKQILAATFYDRKDLQDRLLAERNWRFTYDRWIREHVRYSLESPDKALNAAIAGLRKAHELFEFHRDNKVYTLNEAFSDTFPTKQFETGIIRGSASPKGYSVNYQGQEISGDALCAQLDQWAANGTIEQDTAESLKLVAKNPGWCDALRDRYFVLLGANAAMGPLHVLLALGANIIAVDIPFPNVWRAIITAARNSAGTLYFPLKVPYDSVKDNDEELFKAAGANLVEEGPEVARWLLQQAPGAALTIGNYVYLDSALFVRVSVACDAIMQAVCAQRKNTNIAFLCTPTDVHVIPEATHRAAARNCSGLRRLLFFPFELSPIGKLRLKKNVQPSVKAADGSLSFYVDGLVIDQGFNYAISKRMQHWRCVVARSQGHLASSHIAPSTATISVLKNRTFAWAYDGLPVVCPTIEIFQQQTSNSVMTGLLINDLSNPESFANPQKPLRNPLELFSHNSFHGGVWTMPYTMASTGAVSVIMHFIKVLRPLIFLLFLAFLWIVFQRVYA